MNKQIIENIKNDAFDKMVKRAEQVLTPMYPSPKPPVASLEKMLRGIK